MFGKWFVSLIVVVALSVMSVAASADIIVNGDFETDATHPAVPSPWARVDTDGVATDSNAFGSKATGNVWNPVSDPANPSYLWVHSKNGNNSATFVEAYQNIIVPLPGDLVLTWVDAPRTGPSGSTVGNSTYQILLNDVVMGTFNTVTVAGFAGWTPRSLDLGTIAANTYKLAFRNVTTLTTNPEMSGSADSLFGIDNVAATVTPIPEPATLGLLAIGGLMMVHRRR